MNDMIAHRQTLKSLVTERTGLVIRADDEEGFRAAVLKGMKEHALGDEDAYCRLLLSTSEKSVQEWKRLISFLTVGESYFFRDSNQFKLLEERIIPDLISRRQNQRALHMWSAGCSTGEETYSLAILLTEILPEISDWDIHILGTDINEEAVAKAKLGIFGTWSFRRVRPDIKELYFQHTGQGWRLNDQIRAMTDFRVENLLDMGEQSDRRKNLMDLIICRNVFIYFNHEAISRALDVLSQSLREEGYLITGHGELMGQSTAERGLHVTIHPSSVSYQKVSKTQVVEGLHSPETKRRKAIVPNRESRRPVRDVSHSPRTTDSSTKGKILPDEKKLLRDFFRQGQYQTIIETGKKIVAKDPRNFETFSLMAQAYANLGQYEEATQLCEKMIEIQDEAASAYLLLAHIAEVRGNYEEAKKLLKKTIYLEPKCVAAYVELNGIYTKEHNEERAAKMRSSALELLKELPMDTVIEPYEGITAEELIRYFTETIQ